MSSLRILLVDDEDDFRVGLAALLRRTYSWVVDEFRDVESGLEAILGGQYDVALVDIVFEGGGLDGVSFLKEAWRHQVDVPVILITAHASLSSAIGGLRDGAVDYICKPFSHVEVAHAVVRANALHQMERRLRAIEHAVGVPGRAASLQRLARDVTECAQPGIGANGLLFWLSPGEVLGVVASMGARGPLTSSEERALETCLRRQPAKAQLREAMQSGRAVSLAACRHSSGRRTATPSRRQRRSRP